MVSILSSRGQMRGPGSSSSSSSKYGIPNLISSGIGGAGMNTSAASRVPGMTPPGGMTTPGGTLANADAETRIALLSQTLEDAGSRAPSARSRSSVPSRNSQASRGSQSQVSSRGGQSQRSIKSTGNAVLQTPRMQTGTWSSRSPTIPPSRHSASSLCSSNRTVEGVSVSETPSSVLRTELEEEHRRRVEAEKELARLKTMLDDQGVNLA